MTTTEYLQTKIEFLKGIGPARAELLQKELQIFTFDDLLQYYPFRHEDRSKFYNISEIHEELPYIQVKGVIKNLQVIGVGGKKRLTATLQDDTGVVELVWFQGIKWVTESVKSGVTYVVFGKPNVFGRKLNIAHPEIEVYTESAENKGLHPVYSITEKLKNKQMDSRAIARLTEKLVAQCYEHIPENLPKNLLEDYKLVSRAEAIKNIHYPSSVQELEKAKARLKFEELFYLQLKMLRQKGLRKSQFQGFIFKEIPSFVDFYNNHLPFPLTEAQKRVLREIRKDVSTGKQMNRLLQGDVGSGKTIVGFLTMLMAIDNGLQACLMAPTEILADQHYQGLKEFAEKINLPIAKLTGSTKKKERTEIHERLRDGSLKILIGTHALLEDEVQFNHLGICIIDEQHRFGVAQRARLWKKNKDIPPHVLVMTATPIPRTLAMTLYGDLDVSVIDELPAGRKPISTIHKYDSHRLEVFGFIKKQIDAGRQIYIVYPLIEESEKLDLKDLMDGYESIVRAFPDVPVSMVHGRMKPEDKDYEMQRFVKAETKIMVATTVIEVGVNVPNASVMVIENAERFGLSQLHQLRGRVGRGAEQSYCVLMTDYKISKDSKTRIETMVRTNNGFEIADVDLRLRGPGDLAGTQQSGVLDLKLADLAQDSTTVQLSRQAAIEILKEDPELQLPAHAGIRQYIIQKRKTNMDWGRIS
ncbi:MAG: ATP-dependent DNA helicase RecG [Cytophagaceae bacterium]